MAIFTFEMIPDKFISSAQNALVTKVLSLRLKSRERRKSGLFVLEGRREFRLAVKGGYQIDTLLYCPALIPEEELTETLSPLSEIPELIELSAEVYAKIAYRGSTQGVLAISRAKIHELTALKIGRANPLLLVAESPEKPGNIGALLRTADAAGLDGVLIANPVGDLYNPNVIRSSMGCLFTVPLGVASSPQILDYLRSRSCRIFCAALTASVPYSEADYRGPTAIVVGSEAGGLDPLWLEAADTNIIIPMSGEIDSMNVSVSAAILIFEARRQRALQSGSEQP